MEFYTLQVAGCERKLPICPISDKVSIAAFVMFSDVEVTIASAKALLARVPAFDVIVTAESKGIPLAYEMARQSGRKYFVVRKVHKLYMAEPFTIVVKSITHETVQTLYLDGAEAEYIKGRRVLIADDVISTGESLNAIAQLVEKAGGEIVGKCAVLAEGDAADREDIIFLEKLPLFFQ